MCLIETNNLFKVPYVKLQYLIIQLYDVKCIIWALHYMLVYANLLAIGGYKYFSKLPGFSSTQHCVNALKTIYEKTFFVSSLINAAQWSLVFIVDFVIALQIWERRMNWDFHPVKLSI